MPRIFDNIEKSLLHALQETLELSDHADHKRTGDPIVIWRDGKVVKIPADQIEVREPEAEYGQLKKRANKLCLLTLNEPGYFGYFPQGVAML